MEDNLLRGKNPIIHASAFQYVTVWHSKLILVCFLFSFLWICRCSCNGAFKYFMPFQLFMRQPIIQRYRFISPIKTPCRCPHMSRLGLLICSPRFSAWLINKCPCNFAQLVSHSSYWLKKERKTYSILMHIRGNSDTSSAGIDHSLSRLQRCMPMTSIIRPHSCWLMHSRQARPSSAPSEQLWLTPFIISLLYSHPFLSSLSFGTSPISNPLPFSPSPSSFIPLLPSPLVSLHFCSFFVPSSNQIMVTPCWC